MNYHDGCFPLLELGDTYKQSLLNYERIRAKMKGRIACHRESVGVIGQVASLCAGDHLEIGTLFGGTAIAALMVKAAGKVYCVDPFGRYYNVPKDPLTKLTPSVEIVKENIGIFQLPEERFCIVPEKSNPWPLAPDAQFDTALVDGDHSWDGAMADWLNCREHVRRYVVFDNVDSKHPGVVAAFRAACNDLVWRPVLIFDIVGVVEKCA